MSNVLITQGTQTPIATDTVGTELYQKVKLDVGVAGASVPFTGQVDTPVANSFGTTINSGTNVLGTIKAAPGVGTSIYITDLIISVGSASSVVVASGTVTSPLVGTLTFAANGGMVSNFRIPLVTTVGSALVYQQSANGPLMIVCNGYVK